MYETVIWATDGSEGAGTALREALRLAEAGARIVAVHCDQRLYRRTEDWPALLGAEDLAASIGRQVEELRAEGVEIELHVCHSHCEAAAVVAEVAARLYADVIVCGTRGHGTLAGAFLGSFTQRLLHIAPCPVLAVGPRGELVATINRSELAARA